MSRLAKNRHLHRRASMICAALLVVGVAAGSLGSCFFETKTSLCESAGLRCKPGQICAAAQAVCVDMNGCGDGIMGGLEVCDDGNTSNKDGCSANCLSDETCGNGIWDKAANEDCDPSVPESGNCSDTCELRECGNSMQDPNEECDTGGDSRSCDYNCEVPACRDGYWNEIAEPCEIMGGERATLGCDGDCTLPLCGDGYTNDSLTAEGNPLESCDLGGADGSRCNGNNGGQGGPGICQVPKCGDHYTNTKFKPSGSSGPVEACDDGTDSANCNGNDSDHDGKDDNEPGETISAMNCQRPRCGDGYWNASYPSAAAGEQCDDGTANSDSQANACRSTCQKAHCGDHVKDTGEECDDNNNSNDDNCPNAIEAPGIKKGTCKPATCGDGFVNSTGNMNREVCDTNGNVGCGQNEECIDCSSCEPRT